MAKSPEPFRAEELLEHLPSLRGLARALVHGDDVEDLVADTMLRAYERPPRHGRNIRAWLTATLRNLAIDRGRRAKSQATRESRIREAAKRSSDGAKPDEVLARSEALHLLHGVLRELDDADHQLLLLRYFEGLNATEIGARLALPPATVRTRLTRALGRLRAKLREQYGSEAFAPCLVLLQPLSTPGLTAGAGFLSVLTMAKSGKAVLAAATLLLAYPLYSVFTPTESAPPDETPLVMAPAITEAGPAALEEVAPVLENRELESVTTADAAQAPEYKTPKIQITVLDAVTRAPVAGAEVFIFDQGSPTFDSEAYHRDLRLSRLGIDDELEAREYGDSYRTNAVGVVDLDGLYSNSLIVCAATESQYARVFDFPIPQDAEIYKCEMLMRPRINLAVQVRFPDGRPVNDAKVAYVSGRRGERLRSQVRAFTGDQGLAELRNLQVATASHEADVTEHLVRVMVASIEPVVHELSLDALPQAPIQIVIPQTVPLRVNVPAEFPTLETWSIRLIAEDEVERSDCFIGQGDTGEAVHSADLSGREALFPYVQPGFRGYVRLQLLVKTRMTFLWQWIEIPADAQGEQFLQLEFPDEDTGVAVEIVNPEGELLDDRDWTASGYIYHDGKVTGVDKRLVSADSDHWSILDRSGVRVDENWSGKFPLSLHATAENGEVQVAFFEFSGIDLEREDPRIRVVAHDDLIASGRVVDLGGNPVAGAYLDFRGKLRDAGNNVYHGFTGRAVTGVDGKYSIRGELGVLEHISITVPGSASESIMKFPEGMAGQDFSIELNANLVGTVHVDDGVSVDAVDARIVDEEGNELRGLVELSSGTGKIRVQYQRAGRAEFVLNDSFGVELYHSPPFELIGGKTVAPEFLNPVDLRGRLHQHRVEVLSPDGSQVEEFVIREVESGRIAKGRSPLTLVSVDSRFRAVVDAPGFALSDPFTVAGNEVVQLSAPIQLKLDLQEGVSLENPKFDWVLRCESSDGSVPDWQLVREVYLDGSGQVLQLPHAGRWQLSLSAQRKGSGTRGSIQRLQNRTAVPLGDTAVHELEILPGQQLSTATLALTAEILDAFLAATQ